MTFDDTPPLSRALPSHSCAGQVANFSLIFWPLLLWSNSAKWNIESGTPQKLLLKTLPHYFLVSICAKFNWPICCCLKHKSINFRNYWVICTFLRLAQKCSRWSIDRAHTFLFMWNMWKRETFCYGNLFASLPWVHKMNKQKALCLRILFWILHVRWLLSGWNFPSGTLMP